MYDGTLGDWRISNLSPCINKGNNDCYTSELPTLDYWGYNRISLNAIDIGVNENMQPVKVITPNDRINQA